jgi:hypothetical protein
MRTIKVLSPVADYADYAGAVLDVPSDLRGKVVGFLDNNKWNFAPLLDGLAEKLRNRYEVRAIVHRKKANSALPAPAELIAELSRECDVVLTGSGD